VNWWDGRAVKVGGGFGGHGVAGPQSNTGSRNLLRNTELAIVPKTSIELFDIMQGTFGMVQTTFGLFHGTFGKVHGTLTPSTSTSTMCL
jgi:hypothetical protein